jgi:hypothetical protein
VTGNAASMAALQRGDPGLAALYQHAQHNYLVPTTRRNYDYLARAYVDFCELRDMQPWPADEVKICAWMLRLTTRVKPSSLKVYLAAVRFVQINLGHDWSITGSEAVRRTKRYIKRRFPRGEKGQKFPVTLRVLRDALPLLPDWPDVTRMRYDDLLVATAAIIAVCGFLRGGEFLHRPRQACFSWFFSLTPCRKQYDVNCSALACCRRALSSSGTMSRLPRSATAAHLLSASRSQRPSGGAVNRPFRCSSWRELPTLALCGFGRRCASDPRT